MRSNKGIVLAGLARGGLAAGARTSGEHGDVMTLHDLDLGEGIDHEDFLARADVLAPGCSGIADRC